MSEPITLREMRDRVLRRLGSVPAVDLGLGPSGTPNPNDKRYSIPLLNNAIEETISDINTQASLGGGQAPVSQAVDAQTANGPLILDLAKSFGLRDAEINEVNRVWWDDGSGNLTVLQPTHFRVLDANRIDFYSEPPSIPQQWWVDSYALWILPGPNLPGTIMAFTGIALHRPANDDDTVDQLPTDLFRVILDGAAAWICATQPYDKVMAANYAILKPRYDRGVMDIKSSFGRMSGEFQGGLTSDDTYRYRRGTR